MEFKKFSIVESLRFGFYTVLENILFFLGLWLIYLSWVVFGVLLITLICYFPFFNTIIAFLQENDSTLMNNLRVPKNYWQFDIHNSMALLVGTIVWGIACSIWYRFLSLGFARICLDFYDYKTSSIKHLLSGFTLLPQGFIMGLLYAILIHLGAFFIGIPIAGIFLYFWLMIYFTAKYGFYDLILVDKKTGMAALKESSRLTKGSIGPIIGLLFILLCINCIAFLFFGIGLLITIPATLLAKTFVYRKLTMQTLTPQKDDQQQDFSTQ